jgi:hypothetical protein
MLILGIVVGICLGVIGSVFYTMSNTNTKPMKEPESPKVYIRRGIWENEYSVRSQDLEGKEDFTVQFELGELESTGSKSKVEIISMSAKKSRFNNENTYNNIKGMVNGTWMLSSEIDWIDDRSKERNSKIDNILNS